MASKFISYRKIKELQEASKAGNPKAKAILDKYLEDKPDMDAIDRLLDDYYSKASIDTLEKVEPKPDEGPAVDSIDERIDESAEDLVEEEPGYESVYPTVETPVEGGFPEVDIDEGHVEEEVNEAVEQAVEVAPEQVEPENNMPEAVEVDLTEDLDRELDGLIDVDEVEDLSFRDYIGEKRRNANRARKDAAYFKAFDQGGRESYLNKKKDESLHGFDGKFRDAERRHDDVSKALDGYDRMVGDLPEDEVAIDVSVAGKAYDDLVDDENAMGAFGRPWDDADNESIKAKLADLVAKYGKRNVVAVLNTLRDDSNAWYGESKGRMESSISKYGKALESLLK